MDIRKVDLNLLPVLDALLRLSSVSLAARELDMSQPAMSYALKRLRDLLGDPLFVRTGRGVAPTARAESLAQPLREILERVRDQLLETGSFSPASAEQAFTLCLSDVGSFVLWPRVVEAVRKEAPGVRLRLRTIEPTRIAAMLESGEIDLAIGAYPKMAGSLFQQRLFDREYVCLMRGGHPLAGRRLSVKQFAAAEHVVVRAPSRIQERIDAELGKQGLIRRVVMELPSYLMLPPLIETGDYLTVVPGQLSDAFHGRARLVGTALPLRLPSIAIRQHWHRRLHADAGNVWLRSVVSRLFLE